MLVLCFYEAEGKAHHRDPLLTLFDGAIMIDVRSDRLVVQEFEHQMRERVRLSRWGFIVPVKWQLTKYLPANAKPQFGAGVDSHLRMAPPMAEQAPGSTQMPEEGPGPGGWCA